MAVKRAGLLVMRWRCRPGVGDGQSYITLETIYSGHSKSNFKDHCGNAAKEHCLGMIAEINVFSVSDEMLW